ncbi:MAG: DUF2914 domain-containing protein [Candidatus Taylorbacteria bacterium]|nr:DUF2914 domain-containing protein [Candidatus Taylorbacteria bacterium]
MSNLYQWSRKHASSLAFVAGFVWDNIMLDRIDHIFANVMLATYLLLAGASIVISNMHEHRKRRTGNERRYARLIPYILQFCFGSLFSAYIIFYTQSASLITDWPFLLFLVFLVVLNEYAHKRYTAPPIQFSIFFFVLFSWSVFSLPVFLGRMGGDVFVMSGLLSLLGVFFLSLIVRSVASPVYAESRSLIAVGVLSLYALFNYAYWTNNIPPIPLALKEIGVYHSVTRTSDGSYNLSFEPKPWHFLQRGTSAVFTRAGNEPVYVWSSVFAPAKLSASLSYTWSYFDPTDDQWIMTDRVPFPLTGGRDDGYRGYTQKFGVFPAQWRVDVETARHELVGRASFEIVNGTVPAGTLVTEVH